MSFTPGPWKVTPRCSNFIDIQHSFGNVKGAITLNLCRVQARESWVDEAEANARLIAASPELLLALQRALLLIEQECADGAHTTEAINARAAILKATGGAA